MAAVGSFSCNANGVLVKQADNILDVHAQQVSRKRTVQLLATTRIALMPMPTL